MKPVMDSIYAVRAEFGRQVKAARLAAGLSRSDVAYEAQQAEVPRFNEHTLYDIENGSRQLKAVEVEFLVKLLNLPAPSDDLARRAGKAGQP